jgi:hypothetical protein
MKMMSSGLKMTTAEYDSAFAGHESDKGVEGVQARFGRVPNPKDCVDFRVLQHIWSGTPVKLDETSGFRYDVFLNFSTRLFA